MWIVCNNAFLSIVQKPEDAADGMLTVRARINGDIEAAFPDVKHLQVEATPDADYAFRARITRENVASAMAAAVFGINYSNFKNSVSDHDRHDAYLEIWRVMYRLQQRRRGSGAVAAVARRDRLARRATKRSGR